MLWTLVSLAAVAYLVGLAVWIVLERRSPAATLAWLLALWALPVIGVLIYYLIGPRRLQRRALKVARAREALSSLRIDPESEYGLDPEDRLRYRQIGALLTATCGSPVSTATAIDVYDEGDDFYAALEREVRAARHHVHIESYIYETDRTGIWLRDLLVERAKAGVEVRLLVDAWSSGGVRRKFTRSLREAGAEVARFNPPALPFVRRPRINFRTHRKIVVCDGHVGFLGGMNVWDVHSRKLSGDAAWRDTHLRLEGAVVRSLQFVFLEDWQYAAGSAPIGDRYLPPEPEVGPYRVQIATSGPDQDHYAIHKLFFAAIAGARETLEVCTPYLVPDDAILTALQTAALRGVRVRLLVPKKGDLYLVTAAGRSYYEPLARYGVEVYEYEPSMIHAKVIVADGDLSIVGTANLDNRSFRLNFEVAAVTYGPETAAVLTEQFERDLTRSRRAEALPADELPFPRRFLESATRLAAPML